MSSQRVITLAKTRAQSLVGVITRSCAAVDKVQIGIIFFIDHPKCWNFFRSYAVFNADNGGALFINFRVLALYISILRPPLSDLTFTQAHLTEHFFNLSILGGFASDLILDCIHWVRSPRLATKFSERLKKRGRYVKFS